jgi:hypothetical protein
MTRSFISIIIILFYVDSIKSFDLPPEIRIGQYFWINLSYLFKTSFLGAIFDTGDVLSRQAFEYAVAKINAQSQLFTRSKIVVTKIDIVNAHDSFSAYKMGNNLSWKIKIHSFLDEIQFAHNYKKEFLLYLLVDWAQHLNSLVH